MPRGDRTGPNGAGPKTGRQMGFCTGNNGPGYSYGRGFGCGRGFGGGRGFGQGWGRGFGNWQENSEPTQTTDIQNLTEEMNRLREQIGALESKLIAKNEN
jgi:hypothetical protein